MALEDHVVGGNILDEPAIRALFQADGSQVLRRAREEIFKLVWLVAPRHAGALEVLFRAERDSFARGLPVALHEGSVRLGIRWDGQHVDAAGWVRVELGSRDGRRVGDCGRGENRDEVCEEQGKERDAEEHGVFVGLFCSWVSSVGAHAGWAGLVEMGV